MSETFEGASGSHNAHARLAPSASERWTSCTASVGLIGSVRDEGSIYADEGTRAHDFAESVLSGKIQIEDVPEDFRPHVKFYVDHCMSLMKPGFEVFVEAKVPLFYSEKDTGTTDFAVVSDEVIRVRDYKHGAGVLVEARDNPQLAIYALSLIRDLQNSMLYSFGPETLVDIGIVQPRHHADQPIRLWAITLADLEEFCRHIEYAAIQIQTGRGLKFAPSVEACRWCPVKGSCEARAAWLTEPLNTAERTGIECLASLPDLSKEDKKAEPLVRLTKAGILDDPTLVRLYERMKPMRQWLDDVEEYLTDRALRGEPAAGTKLVMGREGNRAWADEDAAEKFLKNQGLKEAERFDYKLKSPTKIEEVLKDKLEKTTRTRNLFESLISRSPAKPSLALETDKRPSVSASIDSLPVIEEDYI